MARSLWKGNINFGLVNIPVELYPAENSDEDVTFRLLDRRTMSPIKNERVNEANGKKVPWEEVVKGFEYEKHKFVLVTDRDFKEANVEATQSIDILDFVHAEEIHPMYFDKPYFLVPAKGAGRVYALLRDTLNHSGRAGIAHVVIRIRQHLAAIMARGDALILETLRYARELRDVDDLSLPREAGAVRKNEVELAEKLVEGMSSKWNPEQYHDSYHDDLLKLIRKKVKEGRTEDVEPMHSSRTEKRPKAKVVDVMELLQKSLEESGRRKKSAGSKAAREKEGVTMALSEYRRKRNFQKSPEPRGIKHDTATRRLFVIQKHDATRLHYDFRLELDGVLKSWAVPKGPSLDPGEKRLAVQVEDHPVDYGDFEGIIPSGYGKGTVLLWDHGEWFPEGDPRKGLAGGKLKFRLKGNKLRGGWTLVRMGNHLGKDAKPQWLLIKERDNDASTRDILKNNPNSITTGRSLAEIAADKQSRQYGSASEEGKFDSLPLKNAKTPDGKVSRSNSQERLKKGGMPNQTAVELATLVDTAPEGDEWLHEIKYDGYRILCNLSKGKVSLVSRNGKDWTNRFAPLAELARKLPAQTAILDGEAVVLDRNGVSDFQALQNALSEESTDDVIYYAFDLLYLDGSDLRDLPLIKRKAMLAKLIKGRAKSQDGIRFSEHIGGNGKTFFEQACSLNLEGIVSKRADAVYTSGRGRDWLKIKCVQKQEFVIGGFTDPQNSREGFGALLLGYNENSGELQYAGRVGTGFTNASLIELRGKLSKLERTKSPFARALAGIERRGSIHFLKPKLVCEVTFTGWTRDGLLRHPSFDGLRMDKSAAAIRRELPANTSKAGRARQKNSITPTRKSGSEHDDEISGVKITHPDRIVFPGQGITKYDLALYYDAIAEWMMPYVINRPFSVVRCPQGQGKPCFFQRHVVPGVENIFGEVPVTGKSGTEIYQYIKSPEGLVMLTQLGVLEVHTWGVRANKIDRPDQLTLDLDPGPGVKWSQTLAGARRSRDILAELGLESYPKLSGGKGIHIVVPLTRNHTWPQIKEFAAAIARRMESEDPAGFIATASKAKREGKIYVDYLRNSREASAIAPFSTRARDGAPVATPVSWTELNVRLLPDHFTIRNVIKRLKTLKDDPWNGFFERPQTITAQMRKEIGARVVD